LNDLFVDIRTELRCLNRKDLIEALAKDIPAGTIRFGCRIAAVDADPAGGHGAVLTMADGTTIKAKVNFAVADRRPSPYQLMMIIISCIYSLPEIKLCGQIKIFRS
jgi:hypothetical protein